MPLLVSGWQLWACAVVGAGCGACVVGAGAGGV